MAWLRKIGRIIWKSLLHSEQIVVILLSILFLLFMFTSVIGRHLIETPILWVEEAILLGIFWYYIIAAVYGTYERSYISGGIAQTVIKNPRRREYFAIGCAVVSTVVSCFFAIWGYQYFVWNLEIKPRSTMMRFPLEYSFLSLFVGFSLMTFYFLAEVVNRVRHLRQNMERK